jgi:hypothetical protein
LSACGGFKNALTLATTMTTNYQLPTTNYSKQTQSNPICGERSQTISSLRSLTIERVITSLLPSRPELVEGLPFCFLLFAFFHQLSAAVNA